MAKHRPDKYRTKFSVILSGFRKRYKHVSWEYQLGRPFLYLTKEDGSVIMHQIPYSPKRIKSVSLADLETAVYA
jgi:hypothetical protein